MNFCNLFTNVQLQANHQMPMLRRYWVVEHLKNLNRNQLRRRKSRDLLVLPRIRRLSLFKHKYRNLLLKLRSRFLRNRLKRRNLLFRDRSLQSQLRKCCLKSLRRNLKSIASKSKNLWKRVRRKQNKNKLNKHNKPVNKGTLLWVDLEAKRRKPLVLMVKRSSQQQGNLARKNFN